MHYRRWQRHGDPLGGRIHDGEPRRFIHEVVLAHEGDECILWPFGRHPSGYGQVYFDGRMGQTHRVVCKLAHGEPPTPRHYAAHSCGKGHEGCVSPRHLSWKTPVENAADKLMHGTHNRGERHYNAKLTEADVRQIIALKGTASERLIAERFSVAPQTVHSIYIGQSWSWVSQV